MKTLGTQALQLSERCQPRCALYRGEKLDELGLDRWLP